MTQPTISMSCMLRVASDQLATMHDEALALQDVIASVLAAGGTVDDRDLEGLQSADLLTQKIIALSRYLDALSLTAPRSGQVDPTAPLEAVKLASLADHLENGGADCQSMMENAPLSTPDYAAAS